MRVRGHMAFTDGAIGVNQMCRNTLIAPWAKAKFSTIISTSRGVSVPYSH